MRSVKLACGAILLVGLLAAVAAAQGPAPTVAVTVGKGAVTAPAGPIPAGPTGSSSPARGSGDVEAYPRHAASGLHARPAAQAGRAPEAALGLVFSRASASLSSATPKRALTVDLRPNVTYVLDLAGGRDLRLHDARDDGNSERRRGAGS